MMELWELGRRSSIMHRLQRLRDHHGRDHPRARRKRREAEKDGARTLAGTESVLIQVEHLTKCYGARAGRGRRVVRGGARRGRGAARPERLGQEHPHAVPDRLLLADGGRVRVGGIDVAERPVAARRRGRLPARAGDALSGARRCGAISRFVAGMKGLAARSAAAVVDDVIAQLRPGGRGRASDRQAVEGLPAARRPGAGAARRSGRPGARRADGRARSRADGRDARRCCAGSRRGPCCSRRTSSPRRRRSATRVVILKAGGSSPRTRPAARAARREGAGGWSCASTGPPAAVRAVLASLPGVAGVEPASRTATAGHRFVVRADGGRAGAARRRGAGRRAGLDAARDAHRDADARGPLRARSCS